MFKYELGEQVKSMTTGVKGTITGRVQYITGCDQYCIQPKSKDGRSKPDSIWIDENAIKRCKGKRLKIDNSSIKGGVQDSPKAKY